MVQFVQCERSITFRFQLAEGFCYHIMLKLFDKEGRDITNECTHFCDSLGCLGEPWYSAWGICKDISKELERGETERKMETNETAKDKYDHLFIEISHLEDSSSSCSEPTLPKSNTLPLSSLPGIEATNANLPASHQSNTNSTLFKVLAAQNNKEIEEARKEAIHKTTRQDTEYCIRVWDAWRESRRTQGCVIYQSSLRWIRNTKHIG